MKKTTKKIIEAGLILLACISFILMCAETSDGGICPAWSFGWAASFTACAIILERMGAFRNESDTI